LWGRVTGLHAMSFSETISPFFGRIAFTWFYLSIGGDILADWHRVAGQITAHHMPLAPLWVLMALLLIFMGCVSLFFGYHARYGAIMLFAMTMAAAFALHDYWHHPIGSPERAAEFAVFIRDFAICGGLLVMVGLGPGPFSLDNRGKSGGGKKH
jgi:putative oxidoreductase